MWYHPIQNPAANLDIPKGGEWHTPYLTEFRLCLNIKGFDLQSIRATCAQIYHASHLCNIVCLYTHAPGDTGAHMLTRLSFDQTFEVSVAKPKNKGK